jgi:hypothetical protein
MPGTGSNTRSSPFDRMNEQLERSRQERLDSMQRMQDRMNEQHRSLFNRKSGECLNCNRKLTDAEMNRTSCPYCGVTWDYEIDEYGNKRDLNPASTTGPVFSTPFSAPAAGGGNNALNDRTTRNVAIVIGIFVGLAIVVAIVAGVIFVLMSIASASSSSRQRQYY